MDLDVKKLSRSPKNEFEAVRILSETQIDLTNALLIMQALLDYPDQEYWEFHQKRIEEFIDKYRLC